MSHLDPVGRLVTDTLELSRAAATRHVHVSALREPTCQLPSDPARRLRRWMRGVALMPSRL